MEVSIVLYVEKGYFQIKGSAQLHALLKPSRIISKHALNVHLHAKLAMIYMIILVFHAQILLYCLIVGLVQAAALQVHILSSHNIV